MRGVGAELESGLISGLSEVGEEVSHLLFGGVDDVAGGRVIDGGGNGGTPEIPTRKPPRRPRNLPAHEYDPIPD